MPPRFGRIAAPEPFFSPKRIAVWAGIGFCSLVSLFLFLGTSSDSITNEPPLVFPANTNQLILGDDAAPNEVMLPVTRTMDFNTVTLQSVLSIRTELFRSFQGMLVSEYKPSAEVFSRLNEKAKWVSEAGMFYVGPTQPSAWRGVSFEATPILNPFLLIEPEVWGTSVREPNRINWKEKNISLADASDPTYPFAPKPQVIWLNLHSREIKVQYDLTKFSLYINPHLTTVLRPAPTTFEFSNYNANDLGFKTLQFLPGKSLNCEVDSALKEPMIINDYLTFLPKIYSSPDGYNQRRLRMPGARLVKIKNLPAQAVFGLWSSSEVSQNQLMTPDLTYVINFQ